MVKLDKLSVKELKALQAKIRAELPKRKQQEISALRTKVKDLAHKHGLEPKDLLHGPTGRSRKNKLTAWRDQKTGVIYGGAGRHPEGFDKSRAVPIG
jgi:hypothetical protein